MSPSITSNWTTTTTDPNALIGYSAGTSITTGYSHSFESIPLKINQIVLTTNSPEGFYMHQVAIFKVKRNKSGLITKISHGKTMWIRTKTEEGLNYTAKADSDITEYREDDIIIKTLQTIQI